MTDPQAISTEFVAILRKWLTAEQWAEMRVANALDGPDSSCCASHDYCDANMAMLEAFTTVMAREPAFLDGTDDAGNYSDAGDADIALWGAAWSKAKAEHMTATPEEVRAADAISD